MTFWAQPTKPLAVCFGAAGAVICPVPDTAYSHCCLSSQKRTTEWGFANHIARERSHHCGRPASDLEMGKATTRIQCLVVVWTVYWTPLEYATARRPMPPSRGLPRAINALTVVAGTGSKALPVPPGRKRRVTLTDRETKLCHVRARIDINGWMRYNLMRAIARSTTRLEHSSSRDVDRASCAATTRCRHAGPKCACMPCQQHAVGFVLAFGLHIDHSYISPTKTVWQVLMQTCTHDVACCRSMWTSMACGCVGLQPCTAFKVCSNMIVLPATGRTSSTAQCHQNARAIFIVSTPLREPCKLSAAGKEGCC